jgi:GMP synthase (glutamine-hydrolysing)
VRRLLIVKTGRSLPELVARRGDYEDWILRGLGCAPERARVVCVQEGGTLPAPESVAGAVVTGSSALVSRREPWSEATGRWLVEAVRAGRPILAICYGHQLLAQALGGRVGANPRGREIGSVAVAPRPEAAADPLLGGLSAPWLFQATHVESVLELPPGARGLAGSALDPHQAFAVGERAWGVQFHPEFDADVIRAYLSARRAILRAEGLDADALLRGVRDSDDGRRVLRRFADLLDPPDRHAIFEPPQNGPVIG